VAGQELQRDRAVQRGVACQVDDPHPATVEAALDPVPPERPPLLRVLPLSLALAGLAACDHSPAEPLVADHAAHAAHAARGAETAYAAHGDLLRAVRQQTSRFNATTPALRAGYAASDHCVAHPELGGMGYHWINNTLLDGVFDPLHPEIMLYAPGPGGNLRLVGAEYIVLAGEGVDLAGPARPHFDGRPLDIGGTPFPLPHWSLHVWVHEHNPAGMFAPFNPRVSCG
jgi:hypothetical protein